MFPVAGSPWDYDTPAPPRPLEEEWIDRLISLRVLSLHGDVDADAQARRWIAGDPEARRVWDSVSRDSRLSEGGW
ncbi:hypothetical protein GCM10023201_52000 [Actinomycetospora corticicola]|uniref:Uncharacterized protein n=1 Tax=Actinomycetospora corticicola TaxID=663602 RepID=A0A7Y9J706_9PSEU|nr:hypothetical protein [Actinomycetospora corticicola]NYD37536.1 hypothetical protein [Actinomycetospora corticicola]